MKEYEMRRVVLDRAYAPPNGIDIETGYCTCQPGDMDECVHQLACRWHCEIHNPDNYIVRQQFCQAFKDHDRPDMAELLGKASIGLSGDEIRVLGTSLLLLLNLREN